ncbi:MAG: DUF302 domain-containing protein [Gammaproteobacteria bacterium]
MWRSIAAGSLVLVMVTGCGHFGLHPGPGYDARHDGGPAAGAPNAPQPVRAERMKVYTVDGTFDDVRAFVELAITGRGMVINNVSHIGNMLQRTGKDIGADKRVYAKAEALEFCSATVSRRMMEADPRNIVFCPYIIAIYTLPQVPGKVFVAYRRPPPLGTPASRKALADVEHLLDGIVKEAIGQ